MYQHARAGRASLGRPRPRHRPRLSAARAAAPLAALAARAARPRQARLSRPPGRPSRIGLTKLRGRGAGGGKAAARKGGPGAADPDICT